MENTLENKSRFFAQYWGQKVIALDDEQTFIISDLSQIKNWHLELTPLSDITDEDAKKVAALAYKIRTGNIVDGKGYLHQFDKVNASYPTIISDYLRSKGYALPWMGLSVEQLMKYGWVKLEE